MNAQTSDPEGDPKSVAEDVFEKARLVVEAGLELKAEKPVVIDMRGLTSFADIFIILSGRSDRHVRSIADSIAHALREAGDPPLGVEGHDGASWVLIDANDVVVHVFEPDTRENFDLERLWHDAPTLDLRADLGIADAEDADATIDAKSDTTIDTTSDPKSETVTEAG